MPVTAGAKSHVRGLYPRKKAPLADEDVVQQPAKTARLGEHAARAEQKTAKQDARAGAALRRMKPQNKVLPKKKTNREVRVHAVHAEKTARPDGVDVAQLRLKPAKRYKLKPLQSKKKKSRSLNAQDVAQPKKKPLQKQKLKLKPPQPKKKKSRSQDVRDAVRPKKRPLQKQKLKPLQPKKKKSRSQDVQDAVRPKKRKLERINQAHVGRGGRLKRTETKKKQVRAEPDALGPVRRTKKKRVLDVRDVQVQPKTMEKVHVHAEVDGPKKKSNLFKQAQAPCTKHSSKNLSYVSWNKRSIGLGRLSLLERLKKTRFMFTWNKSMKCIFVIFQCSLVRPMSNVPSRLYGRN
jgi:hypothetical protein